MKEDIKQIEDAVNTVLSGGKVQAVKKDEKSKIKTFGTVEMPNRGYVLQNFSGKKLCRSKSIYKGHGNSITLEKGTKWESIGSELRRMFNFTRKDFE